MSTDSENTPAPDADLVALADEVMRKVLRGERVPRAQQDAAATVLRRVPIGKEAPGQAAAKPGALHIHVSPDVLTPGEEEELARTGRLARDAEA